MRLQRRPSALTHDVLDLDATRRQRVGQQHAMALPPDGFGAHHGHTPSTGEFHQIVERSRKLRCEHVIGITAKRFVSPRTVWRIRAWLPQAAKRCEVPILDAFVCEPRVQCLARKVRMTPRLWNRSDVCEAA